MESDRLDQPDSASDLFSVKGFDVQKATTYTELFEMMCPQYMAIGMSYDEYWNGANDAPRMYRKAYLLKRKMQTEQMWLQGLYVYNAIYNLVPVLNPFSKDPKPIPYDKEPIPFTQEDAEEAIMKREEAKMIERMEYVRRRAINAQNAQKKAEEAEKNKGG